MRKDSRQLQVYLWGVVIVTVPLVVLVSRPAVDGTLGALTARDRLFAVLFSIVLVAGELFPIPVARGRQAGDEITVSSTFGFALLLIAPIDVAIAAQCVALVVDCVARHGRISRVPFNTAQYALAFIAARYVYALLAHAPFTPSPHLAPPSLAPSLVAAIAFLLVNNFLVGCAVALRLNARLHRVLSDDLAWQLSTSAPLLGLGPLGAQAVQWTPWALILLLVPIAALHRSGRLAMRREQEALRDGLTGLANRSLLTSAATRALADRNGRLAMLLLDLDHFKDINDTLGHAVGDQMLVAVARRLSDLSSELDLVCRVGGDEFVVVHRGFENRGDVEKFARRLSAAVREPMVLQGVTLTVGCSVGISLAPDHASSLEDLMRCADIALYSAKNTRDTTRVYDPASDKHSAALLGLPADLRAALEDENDQIWVAFQPQLDIRSGAVLSVECLARWHHPRSGEVAPDVFVPIAENTSLIDALFYRVLDLSLSQLRDWDDQDIRLTASVNLSTRQLSNMGLPVAINRRLVDHGVAPGRLLLEVTESTLMADPEHSSAVLRRLHEMGVRISIDDFGTGYSSLAYLQRLDVDELKIDRSFIADLARTGDATIVRSTIDLGHNLGLQVVAEGVEDSETAEALRHLGCDILQGYLIAPPMTGGAMPRFLAVPLPGLPSQPDLDPVGP